MASRVYNVHIDQALTAFAVQLPSIQGMISDQVCPFSKVKHETDSFYKFYREELKDHEVIVADGVEAPELEIDWTTDTYKCTEKKLKTKMTDRILKNCDSVIAFGQRCTSKLINTLRIRREQRVKVIVETASNWDGSATPTTKWDNATPVIEDDINTVKQAFLLQAGCLPNMCIINDQVRDAIHNYLVHHAASAVSLKEWRGNAYSKGTMSGPYAPFQGLFGIQNWYVGSQIYDTAGIGVQTEVNARIWNDICWFGYVEANPVGNQVQTAMLTFQSRYYQVKKFRKEEVDSTYVQVSHLDVEKVASSELGYLLYGVLT